MHLLIDLGNSRLKWAFSGSGEWQTGAVAYHEKDIADLLGDVWSKNSAPSVAVMVSVASETVRESVAMWVQNTWRIKTHRVQAQLQQLGVANTYRQPAALGADRWAALIGARGEFPASAVCVVNCGTAVTVDALSSEGTFSGGIIFPGLRLLRDSLVRGTAGIRTMEGDDTSCLARSTGDAVAAGTLYGLAGAIERVHREFEESLAEPLKLVIAGGDAEQLAAHLTRPARRVPDLVLKGLERIAATL